MELGLRGKTAVITGGSKGIGYATAKKMAEEGCNISICGTDEKHLEIAVNELKSSGAKCIGNVCDVTKAQDVEKLMNITKEEFGSIDILVNNAGVLKPSLISETDEELWDMIISINLKSVFLCSKYAFNIMKEQKKGVILNASSFAANVPSITHAAYGAAKAGVLNFTRTCAAEFAPYGIRVNAYIPGVIATHLTEKMRADENKKGAMLYDIPLNRFGLPEDIASVLVFLASDCSSYITGSAIEISGGKLCVQNAGDAYRML
ncbi:MAG: SDR family NAD(P)-dependent oxidoreductase [Clostridia bacterium]